MSSNLLIWCPIRHFGYNMQDGIQEVFARAINVKDAYECQLC